MDEFRIDSHKLMFHPERVAKLVEAGSDWDKHKGLKPIYAEISTSGACNHRCTFCSVDYIGYKSVFANTNKLKAFFNSAKRIGLKSVMFAGDGEPLLNPDIVPIVEYADHVGIDTSFTTNGVLLSEDKSRSFVDKVSWIKVSINAGNKEDYEKIHRTNQNDFEKVWKNLERFVSIRETASGDCAVGAQTLLLPDNLSSLSDLCMRSKDTGLDYVVIKPYVHNVYMEQAGYSDIDYSAQEYTETVGSLVEKFADSDFKVIARTIYICCPCKYHRKSVCFIKAH